MKKKLNLCLVLATIALIFGFQSSAQATIVLDQESIGPIQNVTFVNSRTGFNRAQTFTVGVNGILDRIEVMGSDALTLALLTTLSGTPTSTVISSVSLSSALNGYMTFDLSAANITVNIGDVLAFEAFGGYSIGSSSNDYANGASYFKNPAFGINSYEQSIGFDIFFRSFVSTSTIPEPAPLALLGFGLLGLGIMRKRRA